MNEKPPEKEAEDEKRDFSDYAFTTTGIIVGFLLVVPEILYSQLGVSILGGSLGDAGTALAEDLVYGIGLFGWDIAHLIK